jgi:hypothetical protein
MNSVHANILDRPCKSFVLYSRMTLFIFSVSVIKQIINLMCRQEMTGRLSLTVLHVEYVKEEQAVS